ncbi:universal stress protein [Kitasatospora sp. NPDC101155]|uniref:universal stress protein n=1 Tax=Kitasatospora sp. NPDC101155 TaxID=3364097 RepID=UPI003808DA5C
MTVPRPKTGGGSPESLAATEWAVREAQRRRCSLVLLQAWPWPARDVAGSDETYRRNMEQLAACEVELSALSAIGTGFPVTSSHVRTEPAEALEAAGLRPPSWCSAHAGWTPSTVSWSARLLVVGRRTRWLPLGAHLGPVAHAVIHHVRCPVAVVPYA